MGRGEEVSLWTPTACPARPRKRSLGGGPQGWGRVGAVREETPNAHSLLEVHLCHLTLEGRKNTIQFLLWKGLQTLLSKSHTISAQKTFHPGSIFLLGSSCGSS